MTISQDLFPTCLVTVKRRLEIHFNTPFCDRLSSQIFQEKYQNQILNVILIVKAPVFLLIAGSSLGLRGHLHLLFFVFLVLHVRLLPLLLVILEDIGAFLVFGLVALAQGTGVLRAGRMMELILKKLVYGWMVVK